MSKHQFQQFCAFVVVACMLVSLQIWHFCAAAVAVAAVLAAQQQHDATPLHVQGQRHNQLVYVLV